MNDSQSFYFSSSRVALGLALSAIYETICIAAVFLYFPTFPMASLIAGLGAAALLPTTVRLLLFLSTPRIPAITVEATHLAYRKGCRSKSIQLSTIRAVELQRPSEDEGVNALKVEFQVPLESDPQRPTELIPLFLVAARHSEVLNALKQKIQYA